MKANSITYSRKKDDETIAVNLDVPEGQTAEQVLEIARGWTAAQFGEIPTKEELEDAERKIAASKYQQL